MRSTEAEQQGQEVEEIEEVYRILRSLELSRSLLTLHQGQNKTAFSSLLLETNLAERYMVLDELTPASGNSLLEQGKAFRVVGYYQGVQAIFELHHAKSAINLGFDNAFRCPLPDKVFYKQRRNAFRVNLPRSSNAVIKLTSDLRSTPLSARIIDISSDGIGCDFNEYIKPDIEKDSLFEAVLSIDNTAIIECLVSARKPYYDKGTGTTHCGFTFAGLNAQQQKVIDRFLLDLQRKARKTQARS